MDVRSIFTFRTLRRQMTKGRSIVLSSIVIVFSDIKGCTLIQRIQRHSYERIIHRLSIDFGNQLCGYIEEHVLSRHVRYLPSIIMKYVGISNKFNGK